MATRELTADEQKQIQLYKDQWAAANAAGDKAGMEAAHAGAEAIRNSAGFSGGDDGGQVLLGGQAQQNNAQQNTQTQTTGGQSAADVEKWLADYYNANLGNNGWSNGYSVGMNLRSMANYIRQQMDANSKAWATADAATREYLHDQNQQLAKLLSENNGGAQSWYNDQTGRWETDNANLGYGYNVGQYNDPDWYKNQYGMTDEQVENYRNDTDRYYNFVDQRVVRNWLDESSGFTGEYAQFVNGPYAQLLGGTKGVPRSVYVDIIGDSFGMEDEYVPVRDSNGNIVAQAPALKNNNASDYTRALSAYTENGIIMPNVLNGSRSADKGEDSLYRNMVGSGPNYATSMDEAEENGTKWVPAPGDLYTDKFLINSKPSDSSGNTGGDLESYLRQIYAANLENQKAQLEAAYKQNLSELDQSLAKSDAGYTEQKRQTTGTAEKEQANWRELANAMGLNSGAQGQAALAQSNQLQSNLNALNSAQATAQADIERQRALLGQQYQLAILQAQADNDFELANALYNEAVRKDEALRQQEQFNAQLQLQYAQMAQSMLGTLISNSDKFKVAGLGGKTGGGNDGVYLPYETPATEDEYTDLNADDVDYFYELRSAGSQIANAKDNTQKAALENRVIDTLSKMVSDGTLTEAQAKVWLNEYGI